MSDNEMLKLAERIESQRSTITTAPDEWAAKINLTNADVALIVSALRAAATSAEPVAWRSRMNGASLWDYFESEPRGPSSHLFETSPLYTHPAPDAEIVAALEATLCELTCCANQLAARGLPGHPDDSVSRAQAKARSILAAVKGRANE